MTVGTRLFTFFKGRQIGSDASGNRYFLERKPWRGARARRWVLYKGAADASAVPPEWHAWLHFTTDEKLPEARRRPWQKPHLANPTGSAKGYRPPGHDYEGGARAPAAGDYEAWTPTQRADG